MKKEPQDDRDVGAVFTEVEVISEFEAICRAERGSDTAQEALLIELRHGDGRAVAAAEKLRKRLAILAECYCALASASDAQYAREKEAAHRWNEANRCRD